MLIGGTEKMVVFNDMEPTEKIKIYDTGYQYKNDDEKNDILVDYRTGDINVPKIKMTEALSLMAADFIKSIKNNTTPISNAQLGLDVVEILDAAARSIKSNGKEISLAWRLFQKIPTRNHWITLTLVRMLKYMTL